MVCLVTPLWDDDAYKQGEGRLVISRSGREGGRWDRSHDLIGYEGVEGCV